MDKTLGLQDDTDTDADRKGALGDALGMHVTDKGDILDGALEVHENGKMGTKDDTIEIHATGKGDAMDKTLGCLMIRILMLEQRVHWMMPWGCLVRVRGVQWMMPFLHSPFCGVLHSRTSGSCS